MIDPTMGTINLPDAELSPMMPARLNMADALFGGTQQRVLGLLFGQPERSFYFNELIALVDAGKGVVQRELAKLERSELVTVRSSGNQKHFQANPASPIYAELRGIAQKTMGLAQPLRAALEPLASRITAAFIFGSVAKRQDAASSDVDLMIVSAEVTYADVFSVLEAPTRALGRSINPTVYTPDDLSLRIQRGDSFVTRVQQQPKIWLIGDEYSFAA